MLAASFLISGLVFFVRWQGWLQTFELKALDFLMQQQEVQKSNDNLLSVLVADDSDTLPNISQSSHETENGARLLADSTIDVILEKLNKYKPAVIGLGIVPKGNQEGNIEGKYKNLKSSLQRGNLIGICVIENPDVKQQPTNAPRDLPSERIGFYDVFPDEEDDVIRRNLLFTGVNNEKTCKGKEAYSFSFKIVSQYWYFKYNIKNLKIDDSKDNENFYTIGKKKIYPLIMYHQGGYNHPSSKVSDSEGVILLFKPQPYEKSEDIANIFSLSDVIYDRVPPKFIKDKIILVGYDGSERRFKTQYSKGNKFNDQIPEILVHALMVRELIDVLEGKQSFISVWIFWKDYLWLLGWSVLGGLITLIVKLQKFWQFKIIFYIGISLGGLYISCWIMLIFCNLWIPLVPTIITLLLTSCAVTTYKLIKQSITT
ncbi:MAG: CHASE2 domain-containing protein [Gloeotrichia echinulata GP01]